MPVAVRSVPPPGRMRPLPRSRGFTVVGGPKTPFLTSKVTRTSGVFGRAKRKRALVRLAFTASLTK